MKHIAWLAVVALAACTTFDSVERDVCGNGLLEAHEDCDSSADNCVSCSLTCTPGNLELNATECPSADYHCGVDGLCHAPGGVLSPQENVGAFEVNEFRISDVDHDSYGDALGVSRSSIVVRYGDGVTPMSRLDSMITPPQTGAAAFGDLDGDPSADLSIISLDGIVSYTSRFNRMSGLEVVDSITNNPSAKLYSVFPLGPQMLGVFFNVGGNIVLDVVDLTDPANPVSAVPCGRAIPVGDFSFDDFDVYSTGSATSDSVIAMATGTSAQKQLCVLSVHKPLLQLPTVTDVTPMPNGGFARKPILADLTNDNDACPALLQSTATLRRWDGVKQPAGHCGFAASATNMAVPPNTLTTTKLIGRIPMIPYVFAIGSPDLLVFETGVITYFSATNTYAEFYRSARPITGVAYGDVDGDGNVDGALTGSGDDIEILLRSNPALPTFEGYFIDTASQPSNLRLDDFDGNGRADVAYTEPVDESVRLMISYGTSDLPLPPVESGRFADVTAAAPIHLGSSSDVLGLVADLVLLFPGDPPRITVLSGSTQRTMLSFFDPRSDDTNLFNDTSVKDTTIFRGAVIGRFATQGTTDFPDVVGIAALRPGVRVDASAAVPKVPMRAFTIRGTDAGLDGTRTDGIELTQVIDCSIPGATGGLCVDDAKYLPWALGDRDVVIAIDKKRSGVVVDPAAVISNKLSPTPFTIGAPEGTAIRSLRAVDLDGDGTKQLLAIFGPSGMSKISAILVCDVDATGVPGTCHDVLADIQAVSPTVSACVDAAPGHFGYRDPATMAVVGSDLIVLCREMGSSLYRVTTDAMTGTHVQQLVHVSDSLTSLQIGDVTGDQVDDIVATEGDAGSRNLVVLAQCTNRDAACLEAK